MILELYRTSLECTSDSSSDDHLAVLISDIDDVSCVVVFPNIPIAPFLDRHLAPNLTPIVVDNGVGKANIWYLIAKPLEMQAAAMRTYRVARLQRVTLLEEHFSRDPSFDLEDFWRAAGAQFERAARQHEPLCSAMLRVHPDMLWYFPSYLEGIYTRLGEAEAAGWHTLQVEFASFGEARMRVLDLGSYVEVLVPTALRTAVLDTARAILQYADGPAPRASQSGLREMARRNPLADRPSEGEYGIGPYAS